MHEPDLHDPWQQDQLALVGNCYCIVYVIITFGMGVTQSMTYISSPQTCS